MNLNDKYYPYNPDGSQRIINTLEETKVCRQCKQLKPLSAFLKFSETFKVEATTGVCRECYNRLITFMDKAKRGE